MRVGDKSKKLTFEERTQLMYDKGERFFEDKPVPEADIEDIDIEFVKAYIQKIGYSKSPLEYLKENKGFAKEKIYFENDYPMFPDKPVISLCLILIITMKKMGTILQILMMSGWK